jgi:predicted nucleotidyltransferase
MPLPTVPVLDLPDDVRETLEKYLTDLEQHWPADVDGVLLFGSAARGDFIAGRSNINILMTMRHLTVEVLQRAARLHRQWGKYQIVAPLMLTQEELRQTSHLFPLEYLQMQDHHILLTGRSPFATGSIETIHLGWQCEQELMANLLRLRQRFVEGEGRVEAIQALLILSITAVIPCLRGIVRVLGLSSRGRDMQILERLPQALQFDSAVLIEMLHIKRGLSSPGSLEWPKMYERYLQNLESLWKRIQSLRQEGRL